MLLLLVHALPSVDLVDEIVVICAVDGSEIDGSTNEGHVVGEDKGLVKGHRHVLDVVE